MRSKAECISLLLPMLKGMARPNCFGRSLWLAWTSGKNFPNYRKLEKLGEILGRNLYFIFDDSFSSINDVVEYKRIERNKNIRVRYANDPNYRVKTNLRQWKTTPIAIRNRMLKGMSQEEREAYFQAKQNAHAENREKHIPHCKQPIYGWYEVLKKYNYCCAYCGVRRSRKKCETISLQMDHIFPIRSKYFEHSIHNIAPACRKCNASKGSSDLRSWAIRTNKQPSLLVLNQYWEQIRRKNNEASI